MNEPTEVLFVCVHNSGRSRMAEAFFNKLVEERGVEGLRASSAGTAPSDHANAAVIAAMADVGIEISDVPGRLLTAASSDAATKFVSMGCGDANACPARLRNDMEDWDLDDPKDKSATEVAAIRDEVRARVVALIDAMTS